MAETLKRSLMIELEILAQLPEEDRWRYLVAKLFCSVVKIALSIYGVSIGANVMDLVKWW